MLLTPSARLSSKYRRVMFLICFASDDSGPTRQMAFFVMRNRSVSCSGKLDSAPIASLIMRWNWWSLMPEPRPLMTCPASAPVTLHSYKSTRIWLRDLTGEFYIMWIVIRYGNED